jgi:leucyl aminopeptidase (aminopeptidase T)
MIDAALGAMVHALNLVPDDTVLVLTDPETLDCGRAFAAAAERRGCETLTHVLPATGRPLQGLPAGLADLLDGRDVVINAISGDVREVPFRLEWLALVEGRPDVRMGHSPGIDAEMMAAGPLNVDYGLMQARADALTAGFADAVKVHVTTAAGTDLELDVTDRLLVSDLTARPGAGVNLPCGEVYCCPVETGADGTLVIDACYGSYGKVAAPVTFTVVQGRVTDVACAEPRVRERVVELLDTDEGARTIAELGIGLNPGARLTDRMLEAEKVFGTAHIAFGSNEGMVGGRSRSKVHVDYLFLDPTLTVTTAHGAVRTLLRDGAPEDLGDVV